MADVVGGRRDQRDRPRPKDSGQLFGKANSPSHMMFLFECDACKSAACKLPTDQTSKSRSNEIHSRVTGALSAVRDRPDGPQMRTAAYSSAFRYSLDWLIGPIAAIRLIKTANQPRSALATGMDPDGLVAAVFSLAAISTGIFSAGPAMAQQARSSDPLVIQEQGSFAVGGTVNTAPGTFDPRSRRSRQDRPFAATTPTPSIKSRRKPGSSRS